MVNIARNETSNCESPKIDIFLRKDNVLTDPYILEFIIYDISTPAKLASPVQVYPGSGRASVSLSDCPTGHRLSQGRYVAEWTVDASEPLGAHRITWFFRETATSGERLFSEEFEVFDTLTATGPGLYGTGTVQNLYVTVQDIRDCGIDSSTASDAQVEAALVASQSFIEKATRQWFNPREVTFKADGNNADTLFLSVPIISVNYVKLNSSTDELGTDLYEVYNSIYPEDDRQNPKISLKRQTGDIYATPATSFDRPLMFLKGRRNQEISGTFGYVEADGSTPEQIKRALKILVVERLTSPIYLPAGTVAPTPPPSAPAGDVIAEDTDGHRIKYSFVKFSDERPGLSGITSNREVLATLRIYRAPLSLAVPNPWVP